MAEYISRENTLDVIREMSQRYTDESFAEFAYNIVSNIPAADVQPVKQMLDIMKTVDEQLQEVIDGTMENNKKETDSETRRYGEGFCAGIELAQRYIRNAVNKEG